MNRPALARRLFHPLAAVVLLLSFAASAVPVPAIAGPEFPFGQELLLDVNPMPGSKQVPSLEVGANGATAIDLWCNRMQGQIVVVGNTISILRGPIIVRECSPERMRGDDEVLAALLQVTRWKREGDIVILEGAKRMRFRIATN
jgi:heat shock protein HslJ